MAKKARRAKRAKDQTGTETTIVPAERIHGAILLIRGDAIRQLMAAPAKGSMPLGYKAIQQGRRK